MGKMLAQIGEVCAVYLVFGERLAVLAKSNDRGEFLQKLENTSNMVQIERTNTLIVWKILEEDCGVEI
jgi:hypothetical protein